MAQTVKKATYRQRVYMAIDGSIQLIFGNDPAPLNSDGTEQKLLVDHDISDMAVITDHVGP